jgi:hypothetical protein
MNAPKYVKLDMYEADHPVWIDVNHIISISEVEKASKNFELKSLKVGAIQVTNHGVYFVKQRAAQVIEMVEALYE